MNFIENVLYIHVVETGHWLQVKYTHKISWKFHTHDRSYSQTEMLSEYARFYGRCR